MENIISFTFNEGRGRMTIVLDKFFPTSATRLRKLLKLVDEDYEHRDELRAAIVQHCSQRASALLDGRRDLANKAVEQHTRATEMQPGSTSSPARSSAWLSTARPKRAKPTGSSSKN